MEQRGGDSSNQHEKIFEEFREGHAESVDEAPHGMHTGGVLAVFDLVDIGMIVTGVHGELLLADPALGPDLFEVLTKLITKKKFFFTPIV